MEADTKTEVRETPESQMNPYGTSKERKRCQFCKKKYGVEYPKDIGFGRIEWWNVPYFAVGHIGGGLKSIPRVRSEKTQKAREDLEKWENSEETAHLKAQIDVCSTPPFPPFLTEYSKSIWEEYKEAHKQEIEKAKKEYEAEYAKHHAFLHNPEFDARELTRDELAQLGIKFDLYRHN